MTISGTAWASTTSASSHDRLNRMPSPMRKVSEFTTRKMAPKLRNIRIVDRSETARDSSCPEPMPSWYATGNACRRS